MRKSGKIKKIAAIAMSMCVFCALPVVAGGCDPDSGPGQMQTDPSKIKDGTLNLKKGESTSVGVADYIKANGNAVTVVATEQIVTATLSGGTLTVKAIAEGKGSVTLKCGGVQAVITVNVSANEGSAPVFTDKTINLDLADNPSVEVPLAPDTDDGFQITYSLSTLLSGANVADNKLTFTPTATGDYKIKIKAEYSKDGASGEVEFTVTVKVKRSLLYTVTLNGTLLPDKVAAGGIYTLPAYSGEVAPGKQFAGWKINGEETVRTVGSEITVNENLVIEPHFIDAPQSEPESVKATGTEELYLAENTIDFNISDYITTNGNIVSVSSENPEVATASGADGVVTVTAHKAGKADIKITCKSVEATVTVTVKNAKPTFANGSIEIDVYENETGTYKIAPSSGAETFTYSYEVTGGATIENDILSYTASGAGTATLTVSVTATDSANQAVETVSFTVAVTAINTSENRLINGDFEKGNMEGWTVSDGNVFLETAVISDTTWWGDDLPYNQGGNYHFDGWAAARNTEGDHEDFTYSIKSSTFTLGGSGFISFRMGGRTAVLKVYKEGGEQIAVYENTMFSSENNPHIDKGFRQATMTTFVADLSQYKGEELYVEICDTGTSNWGVAFFDEIITYYKDAPDINNSYDTVHLTSVTSSTGQECDYHISWVAAVNIYTKL